MDSAERIWYGGQWRSLSWVNKKRAYQAAWCRRKKAGCTPERYERLKAQQFNRCAICWQEEPRNLVADHDHETRLPRALLCHRCNLVLGQCHDDAGLLLHMMAYLEKHASTAQE